MNIVEVDLGSLDLRYAKLRAKRPTLEKRLMASLEEAGQQSPVIVVAAEKPGRWVLIEGRKRVWALKRLKAEALEGVLNGKIGAYVATRYLLPFARANASDC